MHTTRPYWAITYINTLLGSVVVEICLCTGDSLVNPTIEMKKKLSAIDYHYDVDRNQFV